MTSCFRFNGSITIQNDKTSDLKIETTPIIFSGSGGWENGIHYYNRDSIIWTDDLANIKARIIQPKYWKDKDSVFAQARERGYHFDDYSSYRYDTTVSGIYTMYPNSSFMIGEFNTKKKMIPSKGNLNGRFTIDRLIIHTDTGTYIANGDQEIWDLLLKLDKNKGNFDKTGQRKKLRHWKVFIRN
jgi:hypothetical protein